MPARPFTTYYLDAYLAHLSEPPILREAKAHAAKLGQITLTMGSYRIVGELPYESFDYCFGTGYTLSEPYSMDEAGDEESRRALESFRAKVNAVMPRIDKSHRLDALDETAANCQESGMSFSQGWYGHICHDHRRLLKMGIPGIEAELGHYRELHSANPDTHLFFEAMEITFRAVKEFIARHADEAEQLVIEADGEDRARLERIARDCRFLCSNPPATFAQALQLLWFLHIIDGYDSVGRFDFALDEFYAADLASGSLTRDEASDLIEEIWRRIHSIQNLTIGGQYPEGGDSSSDLTLLCLEVTERVGRAQPNLCLRVHSGTPERIWEAAGKCMAAGGGLPALYNDDVMIPALIELGVAPEDAYDYCLSGCSQVMIAGRSNFACDDGVFNAAKCLEAALHDGIDPITGKRIGPSTGAPESFLTYEQFQSALGVQIAHAAERLRQVLDAADQHAASCWSYPYRTLLTQDCLANATDFWAGGTRYNAIQTECIGITNTSDSLSAIKRLVFEERVLSLQELVEILDRDWEGAEDLRRRFITRPAKFGNDDPSVDDIAAWVAGSVWTEIRRHRCTRGDGWMIPGGVVFIYHIHFGASTGATPDGRRRGTPLADSCGPSQGRDRQGPTAVLNSVTKLPLALATTTPVVNIKFARQVFTDDERRASVIQIFKSYMSMGGLQLQVGVTDRAELLAAQADPESHGGLVVRVGGYSGYFTQLSKELQDEIISRTENG